jgi:hypothetical protein
MKVIKVKNYITNQFYFASVDDDDSRLDPLGLFSESFQIKSYNHSMISVDYSVIKGNLTKEQAATETIIQRNQNPGSLMPPRVKVAKKIKKVDSESTLKPATQPIESAAASESEIVVDKEIVNSNNLKHTKKGNKDV